MSNLKLEDDFFENMNLELENSKKTDFNLVTGMKETSPKGQVAKTIPRKKTSVVNKVKYEEHCNTLMQRVNDLNKELEEIREEIVFQNSEFEEKKRLHKMKLGRFEEMNEEYNAKIERAKSNLSRIEEDIDKKRRDSLKEIGKLKLEKEFLINTNAEFINESNKIEKNLGDLEERNKEKESQTKSLERLLIDKRIELQKVQVEVEQARREFNEYSEKVDDLAQRRELIKENMAELNAQEARINQERELSLLKIKGQIEVEEQRFDFERKTKLENLNKRLQNLESEWKYDFDKRKKEQEDFLIKREMELEAKFSSYFNDLDAEKDQILSVARNESQRIKAEAEVIKEEAFKNRQKLLDEGSRLKMEAIESATQEVKDAQQRALKLREESELRREVAENFYRKKCNEAEVLLNSARSRSSLILQKANAEIALKNRELESHRSQWEQDKMVRENDFQNEISNRRGQFKESLEKRRASFERQYEEKRKKLDLKLKKNLKWNDEVLNKAKRKEMKKLVSLKERIVNEAQDYVRQEKERIKESRKKELEILYKTKRELVKEKANIESEIEAKYRTLKKAKEKELSQMQSVAAQQNQERKEELEHEYETKYKEKVKALEDFFYGEEKNIKQNVVSYVEEILGEKSESIDLKGDIHRIFDDRKTQQKNTILKNAAFEQVDVKEKNVKAFIWQYGFKIALPGLILATFVFDVNGVRSHILNQSNQVLSEFKKEAEEADRNIVEQVQLEQTYRPQMNSVFKDSYVKNILYTQDFMKIYESEEFQNEWLLQVYEFLSNELELPEELAINFVSAEGSLIKELSEMRSKIQVRFLDNELNKMNARETEVLALQESNFKTPENWKAFMAFRDQFFKKHFAE